MIIVKHTLLIALALQLEFLAGFMFCVMRGITFMNMFIEVILLSLAHNLHARNPNLACVFLTNMRLSANCHAHV